MNMNMKKVCDNVHRTRRICEMSTCLSEDVVSPRGMFFNLMDCTGIAVDGITKRFESGLFSEMVDINHAASHLGRRGLSDSQIGVIKLIFKCKRICGHIPDVFHTMFKNVRVHHHIKGTSWASIRDGLMETCLSQIGSPFPEFKPLFMEYCKVKIRDISSMVRQSRDNIVAQVELPDNVTATTAAILLGKDDVDEKIPDNFLGVFDKYSEKHRRRLVSYILEIHITTRSSLSLRGKNVLSRQQIRSVLGSAVKIVGVESNVVNRSENVALFRAPKTFLRAVKNSQFVKCDVTLRDDPEPFSVFLEVHIAFFLLSTTFPKVFETICV
jgi:hypothetical protein